MKGIAKIKQRAMYFIKRLYLNFKPLVMARRLSKCFALTLLSVYAFATGGTCPASVPSGISSCYYADFVGGSDSNSGTSEASPLKHLPSMTGASGTASTIETSCGGNTSCAGTGFILKGGVTWTNASLGMVWDINGSGSTSSVGCTGSGCVYVGVDPLWFTGASWSRPIFNGGGSQVSPTGTGAGDGVFIRCFCNKVHFDNIEMTGLVFSGSSDVYGQDVYFEFPVGSSGEGTNVEVSNFYIHGWTHTATHEHACAVIGDTGVVNNNTGASFHDSVIDGSDTAENSCTAVFGGPPYIYNNVLQFVTSGMIINGPKSVHDNLISNIVPSFDGTAHLNGIENNASEDVVIYNNVIRHLGSGALGLWSAANSGFNSYIFNNVLYDTDVGNVFDPAPAVCNSAPGCSSCGATYCTSNGGWKAYNNTGECGQDSSPTAVCFNFDSSMSASTLENNHLITSQTSWFVTNGVSVTATTNLQQTKATANGQGYTASQTFAFSPTSISNSTVGAGTGQSSFCTTVSGVDAAAGTACGNSTTYGVSYNTSNHTVSFPADTTLARPSTPDIGAFQFGSAVPAIPAPATNMFVKISKENLDEVFDTLLTAPSRWMREDYPSSSAYASANNFAGQ